MAAEHHAPDNLLALSDLGQKERIQILLSEYAAYRTEINSRTGYGFQIVAISSVAVAWVLQQPWTNYGVWMGLALLIAVVGILAHVNTRDWKKASDRVVQLEHEINSRAGEHLLVGERLTGAAPRTNFIRGLFSKIKPLPPSSLRLPPPRTAFQNRFISPSLMSSLAL